MEIERRDFLKTTGKAITAGAAALALSGKILGANDRVRVAVCGVRGRGVDHIHGFAHVPGAELVALCEVDESVLNERLGDVQKLGLPNPKGYGDIRKLLEDGDIDNQAIHEVEIALCGLGVGFPFSVSAMGAHFMFDDDQETPNTLNTTVYFNDANGKRKLMEIEVRHWITNHEAEIGTGVYGRSAVPPAGIKPAAYKKPPEKQSAVKQQSLGPQDAKTNTIGNIFYGSKGVLAIDGYDAYKTWLTNQLEPGPSGKASGDHYANFIECVRSRRGEDIHSPIEEAHISTTVLHL